MRLCQDQIPATALCCRLFCPLMKVDVISIQLNALQVLRDPHFYLAFFTRETG